LGSGRAEKQNPQRALQEALEMIRNLFIELSAGLGTKIELTKEAVQLADTYLVEKVVGKTSRVDCFHIALATIQWVDTPEF
jgi:hypothetical protein